MRLPNGDRAFVDIRKLSGYCLSPEHPEGRHKARVFASALGLTAEDSEELRLALLAAAQREEAAFVTQDQYGQRYVVDFAMSRSGKTAVIRSAWIVRTDEDFPRLTSSYII